MDKCPGIGSIDRCAAGSIDPSCSYSGNEWRIVPFSHKQETAKTNGAAQIHRGGYQFNINQYKCCWGVHCALPETPKNKKIRSAKPEAKSLFFINLTGTLLVRHLVHFHSAIDNL